MICLSREEGRTGEKKAFLQFFLKIKEEIYSHPPTNSLILITKLTEVYLEL